MFWSFIITLGSAGYVALFYFYPEIRESARYRMGMPIAVFVCMASSYFFYGAISGKVRSIINRLRQTR